MNNTFNMRALLDIKALSDKHSFKCKSRYSSDNIYLKSKDKSNKVFIGICCDCGNPLFIFDAEENSIIDF